MHDSANPTAVPASQVNFQMATLTLRYRSPLSEIGYVRSLADKNVRWFNRLSVILILYMCVYMLLLLLFTYSNQAAGVVTLRLTSILSVCVICSVNLIITHVPFVLDWLGPFAVERIIFLEASFVFAPIVLFSDNYYQCMFLGIDPRAAYKRQLFS